jgi:phage recombination protein Bet
MNIINYEDKNIIETLKQTVAVGTTDAEFRLFTEICKTSGLSPFKREIWCIVTGTGQYRQVQIMTGINGFYAIANTNSAYDGIETDFGPVIEHKDVKLFEVPEWVEARVYRKDRSRPMIIKAYWTEFHKAVLSSSGKPTNWGKMPRVMLSKCAEAMALRKAFPQELNGLYFEEEIRNDEENNKTINGADSFNIPQSRSQEKAQENAEAAQALAKKELLQQMIDAGTSFKYDFGDDLAKEEKKKVWDVLKTLNSQPDPKNKCIHCAEQVKELELYLLIDPEQLEQAIGSN